MEGVHEGFEVILCTVVAVKVAVGEKLDQFTLRLLVLNHCLVDKSYQPVSDQCPLGVIWPMNAQKFASPALGSHRRI